MKAAKRRSSAACCIKIRSGRSSLNYPTEKHMCFTRRYQTPERPPLCCTTLTRLIWQGEKPAAERVRSYRSFITTTIGNTAQSPTDGLAGFVRCCLYGAEYLEPDHLTRLKVRSLNRKRSLALKEFSLGMESLHRFVSGEPLYRVHKCSFGVLAFESEPVDPRL